MENNEESKVNDQYESKFTNKNDNGGAGDSTDNVLPSSHSNQSFSEQLATLTLEQIASEYDESQQGPTVREQKKFSLEDLTLETTVGAGTFGRVELVKDNRKEGKWYALKKMRIKSVIALKQVSHVLSERDILISIDCPYVVNLYWTWRDRINLFLLMEYVPGGELFTHLRNYHKFDEQTSRFYAAEIISAFIYLHSKTIVYRDLKPENVLITQEGHIKLTDFGFAKRIRDRTWTLCGTPEYLSPEVILNRGHGKAVDWWSLGILIHEMLVGQVPFGGDSVVQVYENIIRGEIFFPFNINLSAPSRDIITQLLKVDRTRRLGNMRNGAQDVQNHAWFSNINWEDVAGKRLLPPCRPHVVYDGDPSNFEEYDPEEPVTQDEIFDEEFLMSEFGDFQHTCDTIEQP